ncbi:4-Cys prefix domain-containing protein [Picosynechococcus sp. PCC 7003]
MQQSICLNPACSSFNPIQHNYCSQCRTLLVPKYRYENRLPSRSVGGR